MIKFLIKRRVVSQKKLSFISSQFKRTILKGEERYLMPRLKADGPIDKLPGTIMQNCTFIQYFSMMLHEELILHHQHILDHPVWIMYLKMKRFIQLALANEMSEMQVEQLQDACNDYLDYRNSNIIV